MLENRKITPSGTGREASRLEQSVRKREDYFKRKRKRSKRVGVRSRETGRLLQEEEKGKQAG